MLREELQDRIDTGVCDTAEEGIDQLVDEGLATPMEREALRNEFTR